MSGQNQSTAASFRNNISEASATLTCTIRSASAASQALRFSQGADRAAFCSFEYMIEFALARIIG
jgi:hypothetical protein